MSSRTSVRAAFAWLALTTFCIAPARAEFALVPNPAFTTNANQFEYRFVATWDMNPDPPEESLTVGFVGGLDPAAWEVGLLSPPGEPKDLMVRVSHVRAPHGEPRADHFFSFDDVVRPLTGTRRTGQAFQWEHPGQMPPHNDIVRMLLQVPATGKATITSTGLHTRRAAERLAEWSLLGVTGQFKVFQVGGAADGTRIDAPAGSPPSTTTAGQHPRGRLGDGATGYRMEVATGGSTLPDPSFVTLAFLGDINGSPGMLDLSGAMDAFVGRDTFLAPLLGDPSGADLYVGIDLSQWLIEPPASFSVGDMFSFVDGKSDALPGIIVGTSPVTFDSMAGEFVTSDPADGTFPVTGMIDGRVVPEPSALVLMVGWALPWMLRRKARCAPC